jgi:hypothetical protein
LLVTLLGCLMSGAAAGCLPAWFASLIGAAELIVAYVAVMALISIVVEGTQCFVRSVFDAAQDVFTNIIGAQPADTAALSAMDCPSARAELARLQQELADARSRRDARRADVDRAQRRVDAARTATALAVSAAIVVGIWAPWLLAAAIAVAGAAAALLVVRAERLARAKQRLADAELALAQAIANEAAVRAIVDQICSNNDPTVPIKPPNLTEIFEP